MQFQRRKLADLRPAEYNPRKKLTPDDAEYQQIKRSIEEFGYSDPIVINSDGTIIKGHQRCNVMMDLGILEADVIVLNIPDKQKEKALNIALNKITGVWDDSLLKDLLLDLDLGGYDFSVTGFDHDDLDALIEVSELQEDAVQDDFDPDAEAPDEAQIISTPGCVWKLGRHTLLCGDATAPDNFKKLLGDVKPDLCITDPPYNVDYGEKYRRLSNFRTHNTVRKTDDLKGDKMKDDDFLEFLSVVFRNIYGALRAGAAYYIFHADAKGSLFRLAAERNGLGLRESLIWEKEQFAIGRQDYQWRHEPILYGWKDGAPHYFVKDRTQDTIFGNAPDFASMKKQELLAWIEELRKSEEYTTTVLFEAKPHSSKLHPTMKPVPLVGRLMTNSSRPGWAVLDPFGGSGTTLVAAEQLGRTCYTMELDPAFCDVIVKRWEELTGEKAVLLDD